jgi:hypothetical protein
MTFFSALLSQKSTVVERHQLEANDPPGRNFVRTVLITRTPTGYSAKIRYESISLDTSSFPTVAQALQALVSKLQAIGFSRIRTRLNFRGARYLAEKEPWTDYPDPIKTETSGSR